VLRFGFAPSKVAFLAHHAWHDRARGAWAEGPDVSRNQYGLSEIKQNLRIFLDRFFRSSQFKRSCVPNSPKIGSGGSLSPRGDWRAPSDFTAAMWLAELKNVPDSEPEAHRREPADSARTIVAPALRIADSARLPSPVSLPARPLRRRKAMAIPAAGGEGTVIG
jgi:hypothetical protein